MIPVDLVAPTTAAEMPVGDGWAFEPKWDGYRAAVLVAGEGRSCRAAAPT